jgi:pimeloyl-ACP methyl ester carboxylesterase
VLFSCGMLSKRPVKTTAGYIVLIVCLSDSFAEHTRSNMSGGFVELPNGKLWVTDTGGTGDPVILLHANTGTTEAWQKQLPALSQAGYRAIAFDRPGRGRSDFQAGPKPLSVTESLDALVEHLKLAKLHLVGVAGGGYVALDYAAWRPQRLRSLVLAATGLGLALDEEALRFRKLAEIPGFRELPPEVRELSPSYRGMNPDGVARWKEIYKSAKQGGGLHAPELRVPNTYTKIASITTPTLVIAGDVDLTSPSAAIRLWAKHLKGHEWQLIPEAGHSVAWEQPEAFNEAVLGFLRKH